jgi:hypothetical protein
MRPLATLAALVLALTAAVVFSAPVAPVESYLAAAGRGETGLVSVRAYTERLKPDAPDVPMKDIRVTLIPYSDALVADLQRVKAGARDSMRTYRTAAGEVQRLEEAYEQAVWEAGGADLIQSGMLDPSGRSSFPGVAAGRWIVWARHDVLRPVAPREAKKADKQTFNLGPKIVGYRTARFWMMSVVVGAGGQATVELTDRNVWFTGVVEETRRQDVTQ